MKWDIATGAMILSIVLICFGAFYLFFFGIWEVFLKSLFTDAQQLEEPSSFHAIRKVLSRSMGVVNRRIMSTKYRTRVTHQIMNAGGMKGMTPEDIMTLQGVACFCFLAVGGVLIFIFRSLLDVNLGWTWLVLFGLGGWLLPKSWLRDQVKKRHGQILQALPYSLDLLTLSVEAGLDFQAAVATVIQKGKRGPLQEELSLMLKHLKMGKTREEALRLLMDRIELPQVSSFVQALIQADRMGTSLGRVLRIQSGQLRVERTQLIEKLAGEAPVKMLFPLIFCIFPTVFMVLFGPILYSLLTGKQ